VTRQEAGAANVPRVLTCGHCGARYLTVREIAQREAVSVRTVQRWLRGARFPGAVQIEAPSGFLWLVPETDLA